MILRLTGVCQNRCSLRLNHGQTYNGYLPYDLGLGGGDYVSIEIDVETGQIIGWDAAEVKEALRDLKLLLP